MGHLDSTKYYTSLLDSAKIIEWLLRLHIYYKVIVRLRKNYDKILRLHFYYFVIVRLHKYYKADCQTPPVRARARLHALMLPTLPQQEYA